MRCFLLIVLSCLLCACRTQRKMSEVVRTETETKNVEVRYEKILVPDTVFFEVPGQSASVVTPDTTSILENDFAKSKASIDSNGMLHHSLETKPQKKPIPTQKEVERKDSIVYVDKLVQVPYPVERNLTKWERAQMKGFWILLAITIVSFGWIFRKPMLKLIRRFI